MITILVCVASHCCRKHVAAIPRILAIGSFIDRKSGAAQRLREIGGQRRIVFDDERAHSVDLDLDLDLDQRSIACIELDFLHASVLREDLHFVDEASVLTRRMTVGVNDEPLRVSPLEFRFLDYLSHQSGRAVSAGELAEHLYGALDTVATNAIEALVTRLRRKLGPNIIETRRGFGYVLKGHEQ